MKDIMDENSNAVFEHIEDVILLLAFLAVIFLRLFGVIDIPWIWVFSPIWFFGGLAILFAVFAIFAAVISLIIDKIKK